VIAVWNLFLPEEAGSPKTVTLHLNGALKAKTAQITVVDKNHGSPLPVWEKMGSPKNPTAAQIEELRKAGAMPAPQSQKLANGEFTITLPPHALALVTVK
jgi:xylan 1,4-beta-xylosidase